MFVFKITAGNGWLGLIQSLLLTLDNHVEFNLRCLKVLASEDC